MTLRPSLDGAVPAGPGPDRHAAIAALTRRVAELGRRLDTVKTVAGLVLTGKAILDAPFVSVLVGSSVLV